MKTYLLSLLLLIGCSTSQNQPSTSASDNILPQLSRLSPDRPTGKKSLFKIKAELVNSRGKTIASDSALLGSCKSCVRGFSINKGLGIIIVGTNQNNLKVLRKNNTSVRVFECPQGKTFKTSYSCTFAIDNKTYELRLKHLN